MNMGDAYIPLFSIAAKPQGAASQISETLIFTLL
jgi:hypothetical protein